MNTIRGLSTIGLVSIFALLISLRSVQAVPALQLQGNFAAD
jgi:hypothetical protein